MNIKYILLALSLALPLQVCAQKEGEKDKKEETEKVDKKKDKKNKDKGPKKKNKGQEEQNAPKPTATPGLIIDTIKQTTTLPLPQEGAHPVVTASPVEPTPSDPTQLNIVRDSLAKAKDRLDKANAERNDLRGQVDSLKGLITSLDPIIFNECILYPLKIRYNPQRINENLRAIKSYRDAVGDKQLSADFKECIKTYLPLIEGENPPYKRYTDELVAFLKDVEGKLRVSSQSDIMIKQMKGQCVKDVKKLRYYPLYQNKDNPPYKSIPFLDNALDTFRRLLNMPETKAEDVQELRYSITPKQ